MKGSGDPESGQRELAGCRIYSECNGKSLHGCKQTSGLIQTRAGNRRRLVRKLLAKAEAVMAAWMKVAGVEARRRGRQKAGLARGLGGPRERGREPGHPGLELESWVPLTEMKLRREGRGGGEDHNTFRCEMPIQMSPKSGEQLELRRPGLGIRVWRSGTQRWFLKSQTRSF